MIQEDWIPADQIAQLKAQISKTGVFDFTRRSYVNADADYACLMLKFGPETEILYCSDFDYAEVNELSHDEKDELTFKRCWNKIVRLVVASRPKSSKALEGKFDLVPALKEIKESIR